MFTFYNQSLYKLPIRSNMAAGGLPSLKSFILYCTVASLCKGFTLLIKGHAHETGGSDYQLKILKKKKISINYKFALFFHPSRWNLISHFCGGLAHRIIYCIRDAAEEKIEDKCLTIQKPPARQKKLGKSVYRYKNHQLGRKNWG